MTTSIVKNIRKPTPALVDRKPKDSDHGSHRIVPNGGKLYAPDSQRVKIANTATDAASAAANGIREEERRFREISPSSRARLSLVRVRRDRAPASKTG